MIIMKNIGFVNGFDFLFRPRLTNSSATIATVVIGEAAVHRGQPAVRKRRLLDGKAGCTPATINSHHPQTIARRKRIFSSVSRFETRHHTTTTD